MSARTPEPGDEFSLSDPAYRQRLFGIALLLLGNTAAAQEALHAAACRVRLAAEQPGTDPALALPRSLIAEIRARPF
ncbi:hypothetical protein [Amycolatopsis sp. CA-230715]|uniref:hypothetical protein n=1 Tax=Amycolatopsis sp. CA-230715 TaxID=2745196 RepID=UPI001C01A5FF|nr:hypothetical protein [Amycolatopsis sp. CA-230715]QWF82440.1 hypothetical protein HUW46_05877 [Amycolatopsis sp. CA-230715]